jgi:hypothetical protein
MTPDERAFRADIEKGPFLLGAAGQKWRLEGIAWPKVFMSVRAREDRWFSFRFDCANFPVALPTVGLWDLERNGQLAAEHWPQTRGGRVGAVFNYAWKGGTALYLPCDREAMPGHEGWMTTIPSLIWRPVEGIVQYLEIIHELLNCDDYKAPTGTAA